MRRCYYTGSELGYIFGAAMLSLEGRGGGGGGGDKSDGEDTLAYSLPLRSSPALSRSLGSVCLLFTSSQYASRSSQSHTPSWSGKGVWSLDSNLYRSQSEDREYRPLTHEELSGVSATCGMADPC